MATVVAKITTNFMSRSVDLTAAGFSLLAGADLAHPVENPMYSRTYDGQNVTVTGMQVGAREAQLPVLITGASNADLQAKLDLLDNIINEINRFGGGKFSFRNKNGTGVTRYEIMNIKRSPVGLMEQEQFKRANITLSMVLNPYGLSPSYDIYDDFSSDSIVLNNGIYNPGGKDWTKVIGTDAYSNIGGMLQAGNPGGSNITCYAHTGTGNTYSDSKAVIKYSFSSIVANKAAGVLVKWVDANNYIAAYQRINTGATDSSLCVDVMANGTLSTYVLATGTLPVANTNYWLVAGLNGNIVTVTGGLTTVPDFYSYTSNFTRKLYDQIETPFVGENVFGTVGIASYNPSGTINFDDYTLRGTCYEVTLPNVIDMRANWGGTEEALADIFFTDSGANTARSMLYSWWSKQAPHNILWNGDGNPLNGASSTTAYGWSVATVSTMTVAATSIVKQLGNARTGLYSFRLTTPATASSGGNFRIWNPRGFKKGKIYTAIGYVKSATTTGSVSIRLGVSSSDMGNGNLAALTTSYQKIWCTWECFGDSDFAYFCIRNNAAVANVIDIDDCMVYEGDINAEPVTKLGGFGYGLISAGSHDAEKLSLNGTAFSTSISSTYMGGIGLVASGALGANGNIDFPILPHLFTPDPFTDDEVDIAVFARINIANTQTGLACAISLAPERGTNYGARRYGNMRSAGKVITLPSATAFRLVYLGNISVKVDRPRPRREFLRLAFTNSGGATGTLALDFITLVPSRNTARTRSGTDSSIVPVFCGTSQVTKLVRSDLSGAVVDYSALGTPGFSQPATPDDGLGGEPIRLPNGDTELLILPSTMIVDPTESSSSSATVANMSGVVHVSVQPRVRLLEA